MSPTIFNNPAIVTKGWYLMCPSRTLARSRVKSFELCGQRVALFRGQDGQVRALDAYCPHMGSDLGIGDVLGNRVRCFFHHWAFDGAGQCQHIPCQSHIPAGAKLQAYATAEKYGFIWVYPDAEAPDGIPEFDELKGHDVTMQADRPLIRHCHHHICMVNGIDVQHLQTVHQLAVDMDITLQHDVGGTQIEFTLTGKLPHQTWRDRLGRWLLGPTYSYSMRYVNGCVGLLTMMKQTRLIPPLHLLYAYVPLSSGETWVQPIYITRKRQGFLGAMVSQGLLGLTRLIYYVLRDGDRHVYNNIAFAAKTLLPMDAPLVEYMRYINQLEPSCWSSHGKLASQHATLP